MDNEGLEVIIEDTNNEEELDSRADQSFGFVEMGEVLAKVQFVVEGSAGALVETLKELEHVGGDVVLQVHVVGLV